jgi:hypothetical protein
MFEDWAEQRSGERNRRQRLHLKELSNDESPEEFCALSDVDVFFFPQRERAHRRGGIASAVLAMAITHVERLAEHLDLHRSAVAFAYARLRHRIAI